MMKGIHNNLYQNYPAHPPAMVLGEQNIAVYMTPEEEAQYKLYKVREALKTIFSDDPSQMVIPESENVFEAIAEEFHLNMMEVHACGIQMFNELLKEQEFKNFKKEIEFLKKENENLKFIKEKELQKLKAENHESVALNKKIEFGNKLQHEFKVEEEVKKQTMPQKEMEMEYHFENMIKPGGELHLNFSDIE